MRKKLVIYLIFLFSIPVIWAQKATIKGSVKNIFGEAVPNVSIFYDTHGAVTDSIGNYRIAIPGNKEISLTFKHLSYHTVSRKIRLKAGEIKTINLVLQPNVESIDEIHIKSRKNEAQGITNVHVETVKNLSSANAGIESTLKVIGLGTSSDNELSTQYKVRGGNYDENLVYVNGIEVYRPFLVRSGQQEGLSFVNVDMTQNVKFSSGGFQAKYGDKLSSVLDITYRKPTGFGLKSELSLLGGSATVEGNSKNNQSTGILGFRYRNNSMLVKNKDIETNYKPRFLDFQSYLTHQINKKLSVDFLGTFSLNDYNYTPTRRSTKFGTVQEPLDLIVDYNGQEIDQYITAFGALNFTYNITDHWNAILVSSLFNTQEEEFYDIEAQYGLGSPEQDAATEDYGQTDYVEGIGSQLNHSRNELDALITNIQLKTNFHKDKSHYKLGIKYQKEAIKDRLIEWEIIDSAGFSIRPPNHLANEQPYEAFEGPIIPYQSIRATNTSHLQRITGFAQWDRKTYINDHQIWTSIGLRTHQWTLGNSYQMEWSPRVQIAIKPNWDKDMLFRLSGGRYVQPPFYKELRNAEGQIQEQVKAQKSLHIVLGTDYSFTIWNRPFKLVSEAYYKYITDVNPYTLDNVRIRYAATNNAVAYAAGIDLRINGEFVPGTESWFNFSYLKTEENIDHQGYIPRPSDQRLKFSLLFQDYVPEIPQLRMYMNLVYNTGVPGGSPTYANPYDYTFRLGDYKRVDLGIFYVLKEAGKKSTKNWLQTFKEFSVGAEIFNMFDMQNAITNTWVRDVYTKKMYGVKNYMTGRIFNIKLKMAL